MGRIAGFEALIRWRRTDRGLLAPMGFIPTAEASGLIVPLGRWVFREACAALVRIKGRLSADCFVSETPFMAINVSGRQLSGPLLVEHIAQSLEETGANPGDVKIEITESTLIDQPEVVAAVLQELRDMGTRIAIDDFGTGYSSLGYLHRFPISTLKIDKSFIQGADKGGASKRKIVRSTIALCRQLHLDVVAEGIETLEQEAQLRAAGCAFGQGYLYSKALPESEALDFARAWRGPELPAQNAPSLIRLVS